MGSQHRSYSQPCAVCFLLQSHRVVEFVRQRRHVLRRLTLTNSEGYFSGGGGQAASLQHGVDEMLAAVEAWQVHKLHVCGTNVREALLRGYPGCHL